MTPHHLHTAFFRDDGNVRASVLLDVIDRIVLLVSVGIGRLLI